MDLFEYKTGYDSAPSTHRVGYWIYARCEKEFKSTGRSGKWMIFCDESEVDKTWSIIKEATAAGLLGGLSKVSTALSSSLSKDNGKTRVICVYTEDHENKEDVFMVRKNLRELGFRKLLYYKPDSMTRANKYGQNAWIYRD